MVLSELDLREVTLVGFSLGTGELARYIGKYGTDRLASCVIIESLAPSFARSAENPQGVDQAGVAATQQTIRADRFAWLTGALHDFLNLDDYLGKRVSEDTVRASWNAGAQRLFGYASAEIVGRPCQCLFEAGEANPVLSPGNRTEGVAWFTRQDGRPFYAAYTIVPRRSWWVSLMD